MRTRVLPPEEWGRLDGIPPYEVLPYVSPENIDVVVVEDDAGDIIGCLSVLRATHLEGLWIKPERRSGVIPRALLRTALSIAGGRHENWALAGATEEALDPMDDLIRRVGGTPLPAQFYVMPVGGKYGLS